LGEKNCIEALIELIKQKSDEMRVKKREEDFTRNRKMNFCRVICFMPGMTKGSMQNGLERFFTSGGERAC
jgi:hypothetical protein